MSGNAGNGKGSFGMLRVAVWLAVSGREQLTRLLVTGIGIGLGVGLLLLAAVAPPAIRAHEGRDAWTNTSAHNVRPGQDEASRDPLLWRLRVDSYRGQEIVRLDEAPLGPRVPLPPGLSRLPGPGQEAVSPALARLLSTVPAQQLADRYPGRPVATVGDAALRYPGQLVVVVGYDPADLRGQPGVVQVRSIETQPNSVAMTRFGRVLVGIGAVGLLVPILVLVGTATRLSAARREQRLAAIRLVGASPGQVRMAAVTEAGLAAAAGTVLGFAGFAIVRPEAARWPVDGFPFFPADLQLSWTAGLLVGLGVPTLAVASAVLALRRVQISPLGVTRQAPVRRPTWRRLIPLAVGLVGLAFTLPAAAATRGAPGPVWLMAAAMCTVILGVVIAGPWLTMGVGRLLVRLARRPSTLLAGHRLTADPRAGFRSISGVVLAVFLVTVAAEASASSRILHTVTGQKVIPAGVVGAQFLFRDNPPLPADRATALAGHLRGIPGVHTVLDLRLAPGGAPGSGDRLPVVTSCADLRATGLGSCPDPRGWVTFNARRLIDGLVQGIGQVAAGVGLQRLPAAALLVTTDGRPATLETVRTAIETAVPQMGELPFTTEETKADSDQQAAQVDRITAAVLAATLLIAGFSLAVSIIGGLLERRRPFALLRLTGTSTAVLRRVLLTETAAPLLTAILVSAGLGFAVGLDLTHAGHRPWRPLADSYWFILGSGTAAALAVALVTTIPLMARLTAPDTTRFE